MRDNRLNEEEGTSRCEGRDERTVISDHCCSCVIDTDRCCREWTTARVADGRELAWAALQAKDSS